MTVDPRLEARRRKVAEGRARSSIGRALRLMMLVLVIGAVAWLLQSPFMSVSRVTVTGVVSSETEAALTRAGIVRGEPLVSLDVEAAEAAVREDPLVVDVTIVRDWPDVVRVAVVERSPLAWIIREGRTGDNVAVDGVVVGEGELPQLAPTVEGTVPEDPSSHRPTLGALAFIDALTPALRVQTTVELRGDEVSAVVAGHPVVLGRPVDMAEKGRALVAVLAAGVDEGLTINLIAPTRPAIGSAETDEGGDGNGEEGGVEGEGDDGEDTGEG